MKHYTAKNRQEMFNNVWQHYIVEGNPRGFDDETDSCVYRGRTCVGDTLVETACAIGIHLPDAVADSLWQKESVGRILHLETCKHLLAGDINEAFLTDLQAHHDGVQERFKNTTLEERLRSFAALHSLTIPEKTNADNRETCTLQ